MSREHGSHLSSADVFGITLAIIFSMLVVAWVMVCGRGWMRTGWKNRNPISEETKLEAGNRIPNSHISRPIRLLPVGQTFTIVQSPLASTNPTGTPLRHERSASMPVAVEHVIKRKRTIIWFDELDRWVPIQTSPSVINGRLPESETFEYISYT